MSSARRAPPLDALARALGALVERDVALGPLTTYRVGGPAALFVEARTEADLGKVRAALRDAPAPLLVVGKGSNLLVADAGFPGLAVRLAAADPSDFIGFSVEPPEGAGDGTLVLRAGAALGLPVLARRAVEAGARGLEWAVGVPGSVGGALRMNAGGHGSDIAASLRRYGWMDLASDRGGEDGIDRLAPSYRSSSIGPAEVVLWAEFAATVGPVDEGRAEIAEIVRWRRANQPGGSNAGSVFANPPGSSAGALVDRAGLKGLRLGTACVSTKHANFIQADEGGSADDVWRLIGRVRAAVEESTGARLETEVRLVGFDQEPSEVPR
ncbi:MAG TPA: FAD-binding protein [Acidimicrobiales bacterium]|nr:FAD-binding protein [Acidimicrobiales bacterium]